MALKAIIDKLDDVAEGFRSEYVEKDGKFYLDVTAVDGFELDNVASLKTALGRERTAKSELEKQVIKFKDLDPDRAREALAKLEEFENIDPTKEADKIANTKFEAAKAQLLKKHGDELTSEQGKSKRYRTKIEQLMVDAVATGAIAEAKGSVELLLPHIQRFTRVAEDGDDFKVEVIDKDGSVRIGDSKGSPMSIKELVAEMRNSETFGRAFEGDGQTGTGKQKSNPSHNGTLKRSQMTAVQKREYQQKHGQEAYLKLPK